MFEHCDMMRTVSQVALIHPVLNMKIKWFCGKSLISAWSL